MIQNELLQKVGIKIGHCANRDDQTGVTVFIAEKDAEIVVIPPMENAQNLIIDESSRTGP
jgi:L-aminopeptidase/D-esterase-like protein